MRSLIIKMFVATSIAITSSASFAQCSDSEYRIYQKYDKFLSDNPSVPDYELRAVFAKKVGMQPSALRELYSRCNRRWLKQSPGEADEYVKNILKNNR